MKFFSYVPLLGGIFNLVLAIFVFMSDRRSRLNQVFFAWGICISVWNLGTFALFQDRAALQAYALAKFAWGLWISVSDFRTFPIFQDHAAADAYAWAKFMQFGVIFIPVTMLHLCLLLSGYKPGKWLVLTYCLHGALALMNAFDMFISGVRYVGYAWYSVADIGFKIYGVAFVQSFASIILLWKKRRTLPRIQRGSFNGILAAQTLLVALGTNDLLPIYGIDYYPWHQPIVPYGSLAAVAYGVMVAYSVFQHQLLDVRFTLGRSGAYLVRFLFLALIAVVLNLLVATFAPAGEMTPFSLVSSIVVIIVAALIATLLFPKLLGGKVDSLERKLMGDHFEYQDKIRAFIERCRWHTEFDELLADLHSLLLNTLNVRGYSLILRDETNRAFTLIRSHPEGAQRPIPEFSSDSTVFQFFAAPKNAYLPLGTGYAHDRNPLEAAARAQLRPLTGVLVFPFLVEQHPLGFLVVDEKTNDRTFTRTDIQLLCDLTTNVALVINQVSLKNQLLQAKELELLGRMSQGMAHDLNNLTTPVWTLLQLLTEGVSSDSLRSELAPVAIRNIQTMREYIREALFFSENLRPDFHTGRLDVLVQEVVEHARQNNRKSKDIQYSLRLVGEVRVEMDHVLIRRLLSNVIANAVDASQQRGNIDVELIRLVKTDPDYDWYRVRVIDHGTGIAEENLNRIFQPYFTTKKTGDLDRGFGLGLAICRKIAALHGGSLAVSSEVGTGTSVNLDLPNCQKKQKLPQMPESLASNN